MTPKTLAVLAALVLGLGGFLWLFERDQPSSDEREEQSRLLLVLDREEVSGLDLVSAGAQIAFERRAEGGGEGEANGDTDRDQWRMTRPLEVPADHFAVDGLVRTLAELEKSRTLEDVSAEDVGLAPPRGSVTLHLGDDERLVVQLGAEIPASTNMVVRLEGGSEAYVVASSLWESFEKGVDEWRSKEVFLGARADIRAVRLSRNEGASVLLQRREDEFWVVEPFEDRADSDSVDSLLREITGMRVADFLDPALPLVELGLDPPRAGVEVSLGEGASFVLAWGDERADGGANHARVDDLVFTTVADLDDALAREAEAWRSKKLSAFPVYKVDAVEIEENGELLELTRDEGAWLRGEDRIDYAAVSDLLYSVSDASAERLVPPSELADLASAELVIRYRSSEGGSERLELFEETPAGLTPARIEGRATLLLLPSSVRDDIQQKLEAVREAETGDSLRTFSADEG